MAVCRKSARRAGVAIGVIAVDAIAADAADHVQRRVPDRP
jgi:hypothetical protein